MRHHPTTSRRPAFTLVELLVVMTIIAVIGALTIGAVSKSFGWVKQKNTEQTMTKVILRLQRVIDRLYKEADDWPASTEPFIMEQAAGSFERARILKVLYLYKWNFPNSYAEAFHNVQESRQLYDNSVVANFPGYPPARAILNKLRQNCPAIPDPFSFAFLARANTSVPAGGEVYTTWPGGTPAIAAMATELPRQSAACMMASFTFANGAPDEFTNNEVKVDSNTIDQNPYLTDAWGSPLLFLRHGNFIYSRHRVGSGGVDRCAWWMGMVKPGALADLDFAPLEFVLNPSTNQPPSGGAITSFYFQRLQLRANTSYPTLSTRDPFDPTGMLKSNQQWRTNNVIFSPPDPMTTFSSWLNPTAGITPWLAPPGSPFPGNAPQNVMMFRRTFGYMPEELTPLGVPNQAYCPMVILSAGGDKIFNSWGDNLDSYRLQINTSGQQ